MLKRGLIVALFVLVTASFVIAEQLGVRSIRYDEVVRAGDDAVFFVSVINEGSHTADEVSVQIMSPDGMDLFAVSGVDELGSGDAESFILPSYVPGDTAPGDYYVRFTIGDDEDSRHVYRIITII